MCFVLFVCVAFTVCVCVLTFIRQLIRKQIHVVCVGGGIEVGVRERESKRKRERKVLSHNTTKTVNNVDVKSSMVK